MMCLLLHLFCLLFICRVPNQNVLCLGPRIMIFFVVCERSSVPGPRSPDHNLKSVSLFLFTTILIMHHNSYYDIAYHLVGVPVLLETLGHFLGLQTFRLHLRTALTHLRLQPLNLPVTKMTKRK